MIIPPDTSDEIERIAELRRYDLLDTPSETEFDDITKLAAYICQTPIAIITLVDSDRQWFKSKIGLDAEQTSRSVSFCGHAIHQREVFEITNAIEDERFHDNPLVIGDPNIRFYAGAPLVTFDDHALGTLCVIDNAPRHLTEDQRDALTRLSRQVIRQCELRLASRQLKEHSEARFRNLFEFAPDALLMTDINGRIAMVNQQTETIFGWRRGELIGLSINQLVLNYQHIVQWESRLKDFSHGNFHIPNERNQGLMALNKNGIQFPVDISWGPIEMNASTMVLVAVRDISATKKNESLLQRQRQLAQLRADIGAIFMNQKNLNALIQECAETVVQHLNAASAHIWLIDEREGKLMLSTNVGISLSAHNTFEQVPADMLQKWGEMLSSQKTQLTNDLINDLIQGDRDWIRNQYLLGFAGFPLLVGDHLLGGMTIYARHPFSNEILVDLNTVAASISSNVARLIAEEKLRVLNVNLEQKIVLRTQEIKQANVELSEFAHVVSHDLKAPLRGIASLAGWLATDYADKFDEDGRKLITLITARVNRLDNLINGILAYSRAGRSREDRLEVDLDLIARNVVELLAPPPHIRFIFDAKLPTVLFEPTKAQQVFQNLFSNAIKFMDKPEGIIRIRCDAEDNHWHICITDNGPGIEAKYFERIFQLFQTLIPRDQVESTGVGLALVKKIIEQVGGRIWVESIPGEGAAFHFVLPQIISHYQI